MDIAEFVEATLTQIVDGVSRAQKATRNAAKPAAESELINPRVMHRADSAPKGKYYTTQSNSNLVHSVEFDVAVTTEGTDTVTGGVKIRVLGIGAGTEGLPITLPRSE